MMKTKILYTTSAMVLALMASKAQAETKIAPYSVVHPQVDFVSTFGLTKGTELKFGVVVNPQSGQSITVTPDGRVSSSYSGGNATQNATLLGMGMINSEKSIDVSTISPGSVTVSGHIGTLNKAGTVKLVFPTEAVTLSDGGTTCGSVVINPALDGENGVITGRQSGENPGLYYYGGTLTLSTSATGKHCVGNGNVTLVFDDSSVYQPDQFNDPVDDFSLIPDDEEEENNNNDDPNDPEELSFEQFRLSNNWGGTGWGDGGALVACPVGTPDCYQADSFVAVTLPSQSNLNIVGANGLQVGEIIYWGHSDGIESEDYYNDAGRLAMLFGQADNAEVFASVTTGDLSMGSTTYGSGQDGSYAYWEFYSLPDENTPAYMYNINEDGVATMVGVTSLGQLMDIESAFQYNSYTGKYVLSATEKD